MNAEYKYHARQRLAAYAPGVYIATMIATLAPMLLQMMFGRILFGSSIGWYNLVSTVYNDALMDYIDRLTGVQALYFAFVSLMLSIITALLKYGYSFYCLKASRGEPVALGDIFYGFAWRPMRIILAEIFINLRVMLLSLLFVIPGIMAAFSYSQTWFVLIDNPDMTSWDAINCSRDLMRGRRMQLFSLDLSFFGWAVLSALTYGISGIYSDAYLQLAQCVFYDSLTYNAPEI